MSAVWNRTIFSHTYTRFPTLYMCFTFSLRLDFTASFLLCSPHFWSYVLLQLLGPCSLPLWCPWVPENVADHYVWIVFICFDNFPSITILLFTVCFWVKFFIYLFESSRDFSVFFFFNTTAAVKPVYQPACHALHRVNSLSTDIAYWNFSPATI